MFKSVPLEKGEGVLQNNNIKTNLPNLPKIPQYQISPDYVIDIWIYVYIICSIYILKYLACSNQDPSKGPALHLTDVFFFFFLTDVF